MNKINIYLPGFLLGKGSGVGEEIKNKKIMKQNAAVTRLIDFRYLILTSLIETPTTMLHNIINLQCIIGIRN